MVKPPQNGGNLHCNNIQLCHLGNLVFFDQPDLNAELVPCLKVYLFCVLMWWWNHSKMECHLNSRSLFPLRSRTIQWEVKASWGGMPQRMMAFKKAFLCRALKPRTWTATCVPRHIRHTYNAVKTFFDPCLQSSVFLTLNLTIKSQTFVSSQRRKLAWITKIKAMKWGI